MGGVTKFLGLLLILSVFLIGWQSNELMKKPKIIEVPIYIPQYSSTPQKIQLQEKKQEINEIPEPEQTKEEQIFEREKPSPQDWIKEDQIHVYEDKVVIDIKNVKWAKFTDTNSMDPVFDKGSNALQLIPKNENQIQIGDIISYEHPQAQGIIIHRVIETGTDSKGWYAIAKGDNNKEQDPGKIRFNQIKKVLIGILY